MRGIPSIISVQEDRNEKRHFYTLREEGKSKRQRWHPPSLLSREEPHPMSLILAGPSVAFLEGTAGNKCSVGPSRDIELSFVHGLWGIRSL